MTTHPSMAGIPLVLGGNVFGWTASGDEGLAVLDAFYEAGGRMLDTADVYSAWAPGHKGGESETTVLLERPDGAAVSAEEAANVALGITLRGYAFDKYKTRKKDEDAGPPRRIAIAVADLGAAERAWNATRPRRLVLCRWRRHSNPRRSSSPGDGACLSSNSASRCGFQDSQCCCASRMSLAKSCRRMTCWRSSARRRASAS